MQLQLIKGEFNANDALTLVKQMVQLKIQFHINQINIQSNEDIEVSIFNQQGQLLLNTREKNIDFSSFANSWFCNGT